MNVVFLLAAFSVTSWPEIKLFLYSKLSPWSYFQTQFDFKSTVQKYSNVYFVLTFYRDN